MSKLEVRVTDVNISRVENGFTVRVKDVGDPSTGWLTYVVDHWSKVVELLSSWDSGYAKKGERQSAP